MFTIIFAFVFFYIVVDGLLNTDPIITLLWACFLMWLFF